MTALLELILVALAAGALVLCLLGVLGRRRGATGAATPSELGSQGASPETCEPRNVVAQPNVAHDGTISQYRVQPGASQRSSHWDPFAEDQSRHHRIRAARRKPRSPRPGGAVRFSPAGDEGRIDHYRMLGVGPDATEAEIEGAFRRYAAEIHPDRFFDDPTRRAQAERKLRQLNAIMEVLRDPERRARYDATR